MSQNKRKQHSAQFKAEIASPYSVHPTMIHNWKRQLLDGASELFERGAKSSATEPETSA
ncbi:hypothetical protein H6F89_26430 [Cyanobacteria bacterium FACHB-63]|nr:hypothetical protein [Cyanobacteria bacterium FACHB-63]